MVDLLKYKIILPLFTTFYHFVNKLLFFSLLSLRKLTNLGQYEISYAISCHYSKWGNKCSTNLDKYLLACDEITGFIVACSKVRPNGVSDLKSKSVLKSLKKKSFAASVDRNEIYHGVDLIGVDLNEHIDFIINVLKENAKILELKR